MEKHGWVLWTILPLLVAGGIWWLTQSPRTDPTHPNMGFFGNNPNGPAPTPAELAGLQGKADAACLCDRRRGRPRDDQCWTDYRQSVARFPPSSWSTMCGLESVSIDCFGPEGSNQLCVSTHREYDACSDAERQARMAEARRRNSNHC